MILSLGIGAYSERSKAVCQEFAAERAASLLVHDLAGEHGYTIPEAAAGNISPRHSVVPLLSAMITLVEHIW